MRVKNLIRAATAVAAFAAFMALPGAAAAHVGVSPAEAPAGQVVDLSLTVGHGCEGASTTSLEVRVPEGVSEYSVGQAPGWRGDKPRPGIMRWKGGPLPDASELALPFRAEFYGRKGDVLVFPVIQGCEGGLETAWISTGEETGAGHGTPAPTVTLTSSAPDPGGDLATARGESGPGEPSGDGGASQDAAAADAASADPAEGGGGEGFPLLRVIGAVLIVASVTAFIVLRRARSRSGE